MKTMFILDPVSLNGFYLMDLTAIVKCSTSLDTVCVLRQNLFKNAYLNAFLVQCVLIEVEDSGLDGAGRG